MTEITITCEHCGCNPCECHDDEDAWLYKDTPSALTAEQFLKWHQTRYGERFQLESPTQQEIPWSELVKLVGVIITVLGVSGNPEQVARQVLPFMRKGG